MSDISSGAPPQVRASGEKDSNLHKKDPEFVPLLRRSATQLPCDGRREERAYEHKAGLMYL